MVRTGLVAPDDLHNIPLTETVAFAQKAERAGFDSIWKQEASGSNAFMALSAIAMVTETIRLGTGIANVYSRSPALLGMSAASLDRLSGGRAILGLGTSTEPIVQRWHGTAFDRPLRRKREAIEIIRAVVAGGEIEYRGELFDIGPYKSRLTTTDGSIPIYSAAMGEANRRLTAELADGWMPVLTPLSSLNDLIADIRDRSRDAGHHPPTIAPWIPVAVADTPEHAEGLMRQHLAQEMGVGYNRVIQQFDIDPSGDDAHDRWVAGDRDGAAAAISDRLLDELTVFGSPEACTDRLDDYADAGADHVILWPSFKAERRDIDRIIDSLGPGSG